MGKKNRKAKGKKSAAKDKSFPVTVAIYLQDGQTLGDLFQNKSEMSKFSTLFSDRPLEIAIHQEGEPHTEKKSKGQGQKKKDDKSLQVIEKEDDKSEKITKKKKDDNKTVLQTIKEKVFTPEVALVTAVAVGQLLFKQYGTTILAAMVTHYPIFAIGALVFSLCFNKEIKSVISAVETTDKAITGLSTLVDVIGKFTEAPEMQI